MIFKIGHNARKTNTKQTKIHIITQTPPKLTYFTRERGVRKAALPIFEEVFVFFYFRKLALPFGLNEKILDIFKVI